MKLLNICGFFVLLFIAGCTSTVDFHDSAAVLTHEEICLDVRSDTVCGVASFGNPSRACPSESTVCSQAEHFELENSTSVRVIQSDFVHTWLEQRIDEFKIIDLRDELFVYTDQKRPDVYWWITTNGEIIEAVLPSTDAGFVDVLLEQYPIDLEDMLNVFWFPVPTPVFSNADLELTQISGWSEKCGSNKLTQLLDRETCNLVLTVVYENDDTMILISFERFKTSTKQDIVDSINALENWSTTRYSGLIYDTDLIGLWNKPDGRLAKISFSIPSSSWSDLVIIQEANKVVVQDDSTTITSYQYIHPVSNSVYTYLFQSLPPDIEYTKKLTNPIY